MAISPFAPADHRWTIGEGGYDDAPLLVRVNSTARRWLGDESLGIKLSFAVPLNEPRAGGLPTPEENEQLMGVEDEIRREVGAGARGIFVLALTTGVMKEFVFDIAAGADIGASHRAIRGRVPTHDVQCMAVRDPSWSASAEFAPDEPEGEGDAVSADSA